MTHKRSHRQGLGTNDLAPVREVKIAALFSRTPGGGFASMPMAGRSGTAVIPNHKPKPILL